MACKVRSRTLYKTLLSAMQCHENFLYEIVWEFQALREKDIKGRNMCCMKNKAILRSIYLDDKSKCVFLPKNASVVLRAL